MSEGIFEFADYKKYLRAWLESRGRGERSRVAEALRCHAAYLSRVLGGSADISLEQAQALSVYLGHSDEEADYLQLLVLHARAGTRALADYYQKKRLRAVEQRNLLKNRLEYRKTLSEVDQSTYFSAWYFAAVHLLLAIPNLQTKDRLVSYLRLSPRRVNQVLEFLVRSGLASERQGRYLTGPVNIHLGSDSAMIARHHTNWRVQAIQSLERDAADSLHYSSVITIPRENAPKIRAILIKAIEQIRKLTSAPNEEALFCYALDLFEVGEANSKA